MLLYSRNLGVLNKGNIVFAKGIEMNATNNVSEIHGFLSGVLIILIGVEESRLSRRLGNVQLCMFSDFIWKKMFF